jgi:hypothetical protein
MELNLAGAVFKAKLTKSFSEARGSASILCRLIIATEGGKMHDLIAQEPELLSDAELDLVGAGQISLGNLINVNVSNLLNNTLNHNNVLNGSLNNLLAASTINILSGLVITVPVTI